jgi:hypothetical protein
VPGIRFWDQHSRFAGPGAAGTRNYVTFHHEPIEVEEKYARGGAIGRAMRAARQAGGETGRQRPYLPMGHFKREENLARHMEGSVTPPVLYHGTQVWEHEGRKLGDIHAFNRNASVDVIKRKPSLDTIGHWFDESPSPKSGAGMYAGSTGAVYPAHVRITNPWRAPDWKTFAEAAKPDPEAFRQSLIDAGHDGIRLPGAIDSREQGPVWVALHPNQIKSAVGNRGTFDPYSPDITRQAGGAVRQEFGRGGRTPEFGNGSGFTDQQIHDLTHMPITSQPSQHPIGSRNKTVVGNELMARQHGLLRRLFRGISRIHSGNATPQMNDMLAEAIAMEAEHALGQRGNGSNWYSDKVNEALRVAALMHPEILTNDHARSAFSAALAITSQGEKVPRNSELGLQLYERFKQHGLDELKRQQPGRNSEPRPDEWLPHARFNVEGLPGGVAGSKYGNAMTLNFRKYDALINNPDIGWDGVRDWLMRPMRAGELEAMGHKLPKGMLVDDPTHGSAIFGPKIGGGFYQNLMGNFDPITQDQWFVKTYGRLAGTLRDIVKGGEAGKQKLYDKFAAELAKPGAGYWTKPPEAEGAPPTPPTPTGKPVSTRAALDRKAAFLAAAHEADFRKYRGHYDAKKRAKTAATSAAIRVHNMNTALQEDPGNGSDRNWRRAIAEKARQILNAKGYPVNNADLQATIWYPEKDVYKHLGSTGGGKRPKKKQDDELDAEVDDDEDDEDNKSNIDYSQAFQGIARQKGHTDDEIRQALGRPLDFDEVAQAQPNSPRDVVGRAGPAAGADVGRGAAELRPQSGGVSPEAQAPAPGLAEGYADGGEVDPRQHAFRSLATAQRGAPEDAMRRAQDALVEHPSGPFYGKLLEHTGDLIHRMTEHGGEQNRYGESAVREKIGNLLPMLGNTSAKARMSAIPHLPEVDRYVDEHRKLPTYNPMHEAAKRAAISVGHKDFNIAATHLWKIKDALDSGTYQDIASRYEPRQERADGGEVPSIGHNNPPPDPDDAPNPVNTETQSRVGDVRFDQEHGAGQVPDNRSVNYKGFTAMMKPSRFLMLSHKLLPNERPGRIEALTQHLAAGNPIGSPFLGVGFDDEDPEKFGKVRQHDGRHRMRAIQALQGDTPVPVHVFGSYSDRARDITPEQIAKLRARMRSQENGIPLIDNFGDAFHMGKVLPGRRGRAEGGPIDPDLKAAQEQGVDTTSIPAIRQAGALSRFHKSLMGSVAERAQAMAQAGRDYHEQGLLPMAVGTRFHTPHSRANGKPPWTVTGHYVDPKDPQRYGYRAARGVPEVDHEAGMLMVSDPASDERLKKLGHDYDRAADVAAWTPFGPPTVAKARGGRAEGGPAKPHLFHSNLHGHRLHIGPIHSSVHGRTDHLPMHVPSGSYVIPADVVSAHGEGNTMAGFRVMRRLFGGAPYGGSGGPYGQGGGPYGEALQNSRGGRAEDGGGDQGVPIVAAGGEYVLSPAQVRSVGNGDSELGTKVMDEWVKRSRARNIKTLKGLPGPAKD